MSELTLTLLRLGYLVLLWLMVLSVVAVLRRDLFGTRVPRRTSDGPDAEPGPPVRSAGPAEERRAAPHTLVVTEGSLRGTTLALGQSSILLGRAPECTLVLDDDFASARHARFFLLNGTWAVEDLGSTNGTFMGRTRVEGPTPVEAGAAVRIGRTVVELRR